MAMEARAQHLNLARHPPADHPREEGPRLASNLLSELAWTTNRDAIVTEAPEERFRLGFFDSAGLIINQMIGEAFFFFFFPQHFLHLDNAR
jgi:hypothetical protein